MNKILIVYFSATGTTEKVAKDIANKLNADIYQIVPKELYTSADLDWNDKNSRTTKEINNPSFRPEIANNLNNIDVYDTIFLGYPIWWDKAPNIIYTFLDKYDFKDKKIIPFCTSGGSNINYSVNDLKNSYKSYHFSLGKRFFNTISNEEVIDLLNK